MREFQEATKANLDAILEDACKGFPHGGDHSMRKKIAQKLLRSAQHGNVTLSGLSEVAHTALSDLTKRR